MPGLAIEHHAICFAQCRLVFQTPLDAFHYAALFILTIRVQLVEPAGDCSGAVNVFFVEKIDHIAGDIHTPSCVEARNDAKRDLGCGQSATVAKLGNLKESLEPDIDRTP